MRGLEAGTLWAGALIVGILLGVACGAAPAPGARPPCAPDGAGLRLPDGLCAVLVAEDVGPVRHLAVSQNGSLVAAVRNRPGAVVLRDADGDGRAELLERFGPGPGQSVALGEGSLYLATHDRVVRWPWRPGAGRPDLRNRAGEVVVDGFPAQREHAAKAIALGPGGVLYVSVGAPSNACQVRNREPRSPGRDPCPELGRHAGIWRYSATQVGQRALEGERVATGLRHTLALAVQPAGGQLFGVVHGRDMLSALWGFSDSDNAELPAEELVEIHAGDDYGWPYCYWDGRLARRVLAPEYGGDGRKVGRCAEKAKPRLAFPAHWAPMAMVFQPGDGLGPAYRGGAFVAFHGSWNRAPLPQEGYRVAFVPFREGRPSGGFETFAIHARDPTGIRFSGLAVAPDGSLYLAADDPGKIWRVLPVPEP